MYQWLIYDFFPTRKKPSFTYDRARWLLKLPNFLGLHNFPKEKALAFRGLSRLRDDFHNACARWWPLMFQHGASLSYHEFMKQVAPCDSLLENSQKPFYLQVCKVGTKDSHLVVEKN